MRRVNHLLRPMAMDLNVWDPSLSSNRESRSLVPDEINISSEDSLDCTDLTTKDSLIKESFRDFDLNFYLSRPTVQTYVTEINSNNRSMCVQNFKTS